jgi:hypothetical protein
MTYKILLNKKELKGKEAVFKFFIHLESPQLRLFLIGTYNSDLL